MKTIPYSAEQRLRHGYTHKVILTHDDLTDTDTSQTIAILTVPAGSVVEKVGVRLTAEFDDAAGAGSGSLSDLNLSIGDDGSTTRWVNASEISVQGTAVAYLASATAYVYLADNTVDAIFASTGANLNTLNAGEVEISLRVVSLTELSRPRGGG